VSTNLSTIVTGLAITNTPMWNIIASSAPKQYFGISTELVGAILLFLGVALGPSLVGIYIQKHQATTNGIGGSFPSSESCNMVFLTSVIISTAFATFLKRRMQN